jgi:hypothetical protein
MRGELEAHNGFRHQRNLSFCVIRINGRSGRGLNYASRVTRHSPLGICRTLYLFLPYFWLAA